jgi:hypothetical protein
MIDRRWVTDFGLAALIAIPMVLPAAPAPRSVESHIAATQSSVALADADAKADEAQL